MLKFLKGMHNKNAYHVGIGVATDLSVETRMDTTSQSDSQSDGLVGCLKCSECGQCRE